MITATRSFRILTAAAVFGGAASIGAGTTSATPSGIPGRIAIGCEEGLWTVDADGTDLVHVTDKAVLSPDWSPAGTKIAFTRLEAPGKAGIWMMNADGSEETRLTAPTNEARDPSWSFTAEYIAYSIRPNSGPRYVRAYNLASGISSVAVAVAGTSINDASLGTIPSADWWSSLVVASVDGGPTGVWINQHAVYEIFQNTSPPEGSNDTEPEWAPSGDRYAFVRDDGATRSIQAVDLDGGDLLQLTPESVDAISPSYAADGSKIAFLSRPAADYGTDAPFDLWAMNADGSGAVQILANVACEQIDWQPVLDPPFVDAQSSFAAAIAWAFDAGIATGCAPDRFCTTRAITRGQVAAFLARALVLPATTHDYFVDDDGTTHEDDINRLAEAGLTMGCGEAAYCPGSGLSRGQIASLIARALDLPQATADHFGDDDGTTHEADINRMAEAGLTSGCAPNRYCPTNPVTRGQAMALIYRALAP